jgi:hypothetical protein
MARNHASLGHQRRAALTHLEVRLENTRSLAACGGGHHFFACTAHSICTSRVRSATICFQPPIFLLERFQLALSTEPSGNAV